MCVLRPMIGHVLQKKEVNLLAILLRVFENFGDLVASMMFIQRLQIGYSLEIERRSIF